jgi:hypothetical protein
MSSLRPFASIVFWTAIVAYTLFGFLGIVLGPFELGSVIPHDATALGQIRFLKACEMALGVGFFSLRHRIHEDPFAQRFVAFALTVTPVARIVAMAADGTPSLAFSVLACFELLGAALFIAYVFGTRRAATAS